MTATTVTTVVPITVCGRDLPMRRTVAKNGNEFFAVLKNGKYSGFGVPIPALDTELPLYVEVAGNVVTLEQVTEVTFTDRKTGRETTKSYAPGTKRSGKALITVDGQTKHFKLTITVTQDPTVWNLTASANAGAGSGGSARKAVSLDSL